MRVARRPSSTGNEERAATQHTDVVRAGGSAHNRRGWAVPIAATNAKPWHTPHASRDAMEIMDAMEDKSSNSQEGRRHARHERQRHTKKGRAAAPWRGPPPATREPVASPHAALRPPLPPPPASPPPPPPPLPPPRSPFSASGSPSFWCAFHGSSRALLRDPPSPHPVRAQRPALSRRPLPNAPPHGTPCRQSTCTRRTCWRGSTCCWRQTSRRAPRRRWRRRRFARAARR
mmetsp:Transcript_70420/g.193233  ORF Transcript_70420/g.193233 Transcript_70420/m.193233 type:complete len:231 (-) Transcript_70420:604-1296(-)